MQGKTVEVEAVEGRPPKTIDVPHDARRGRGGRKRGPDRRERLDLDPAVGGVRHTYTVELKGAWARLEARARGGLRPRRREQTDGLERAASRQPDTGPPARGRLARRIGTVERGDHVGEPERRTCLPAACSGRRLTRRATFQETSRTALSASSRLRSLPVKSSPSKPKWLSSWRRVSTPRVPVIQGAAASDGRARKSRVLARRSGQAGSMRLGFAVKVLGDGGLPSHDTRRWQSDPHLSVSLGLPRPHPRLLRRP